MSDYVVQYGLGGHLGVLSYLGGPLRRGTPVVVRTARGVDLGEVLGLATNQAPKRPGEQTAPSSGWNSGDEESSGGNRLGQERDEGPTDPSAPTSAPAGRVLRVASAEDRLLASRVRRDHTASVSACERQLAAWNLDAVLLDADVTLDGRQVRFEFLTDPELTPAQLDRLAELYRQTSGLDELGSLLTEGCGPGCGTSDAENGCVTGACVSCSLATACGTRSS